MRPARPVLAVLLALAASLAAGLTVAPGAQAAPRVVNGRAVDVTSVPWAVAVLTRTTVCTGTVIDATHVLTAAHCMFTATGAPRQPADLIVGAGTSAYRAPTTDGGFPSFDAGAQTASVTAIATHPRYVDDPAGMTRPDDVAVLTLDHGLDLSTPRVKAVALTPVGAAPGAGGAATLAGFGDQQESPQRADGRLYALDVGLSPDASCAEDPAVQLCATSPSGSPCFGDSGSGLVAGGQVLAVLAGIERCTGGSAAQFGDLSAGELGAWVRSPGTAPPEAPRGPTGGGVSGVAQVGNVLTCDPGAWTGAPTFAYTWTDGATGAVLQAGAANQRLLLTSDAGRRVVCQVIATSAGGQATATSTGTLVAAASPVAAGSGGPTTTGTTLTVAQRPSLRVTSATSVRRGRSLTVRVRLRAGTLALGRTQVCLQTDRGAFARRKGTTRVSSRRTCLTASKLSASRTRTLTLTLRAPAKAGKLKLIASASPAGLSAFTLSRTVRVR